SGVRIDHSRASILKAEQIHQTGPEAFLFFFLNWFRLYLFLLHPLDLEEKLDRVDLLIFRRDERDWFKIRTVILSHHLVNLCGHLLWQILDRFMQGTGPLMECSGPISQLAGTIYHLLNPLMQVG